MRISQTLTFLGLVLSASIASAELITYTITPASSSLSVGSSTLAGNNVSQQTPGSLQTSFSGTILAERIGNTIQFLDGSVISAANQAANQQPESGGLPGSEPANYGMQASTQFGTAFAAVRDLRLDLSSGVINITGGNFPNNFTTVVDDGIIDFNAATSFGDEDLFGDTSGNTAITQSSVATVGPNETLRLQFNISFPWSAQTSGDSNLNFVGTILATGVIPEPVVLPIAGLALLILQRRRVGS